MPALLNAKWEHFAQLINNGESGVQAYSLAGYSAKSAHQNSNALMKKAVVSERIAELRKQKEEMHAESMRQVIEESGVTKAWVIAQLAENVTMAKAAEPVTDANGNPIGEYKQNIQAANRALELLGKELGMFIDRKEVKTGALDDLSPADRRVALEVVQEAIRRAKEIA